MARLNLISIFTGLKVLVLLLFDEFRVQVKEKPKITKNYHALETVLLDKLVFDITCSH